MSLRFSCPNCTTEIISKYLKPGDKLICRNCSYEIIVPTDAAVTDNDSTILKRLKAEPEEIKKFHYDHIANEVDSSEKEKLKKERPKEWGVWSVIKFVIAYFLAIIPIYFLSKLIAQMVSFYFFNEKYNEETLYLIFGGLGYFVPIILIYFSVVIRHGNDFFEALKLSKISKKDVVFYTKISIVIVIAIGALGILIEISPLKNYVPESVPLDEYFNKGYFMLAFFSFMAIIGPFQEELIFRGYIFQGLRNKLGTITSAIIVTALFTYLHSRQLGNSIILLLPILIGAIIFIYIRIKTDSLTKCIIVHQIYNTTLVIIGWTLVLIFGFDSSVQ